MSRVVIFFLLVAIPVIAGPQGLVFRDGGHVYRLTSSARVADKQGLLRSDWAWGLALYRFDGDPPNIPDLAALIPGTSGPLVLNGATGGRILTTASQRHAIAALSTAIELQGIAITPDEIGSPVFSQDGHFLGIVSHQYLQTLPGAPTRVVDWDNVPSHRESHLIVIPAAEVLKWIREAPRVYFKPLSATRVTADGMIFEAICPPAVSGGSQAPIGGPDGVGIGGDSPKEPPCEIAISASADAGLGVPPSMAKNFERLHSAIGERALFFLGPDLGRISFYHVGEFVRYLASPELTLVLSSSKDTELHRIGERVSELARQRYENRHDVLAERDGLLRKLYLAGQVLASDRPELFPHGELLRLADQKHQYQWAWYNFELEDRAAAEEVEAKLLRAASL